MSCNVQVKYTGGTPGADSDAYVLFDSSTMAQSRPFSGSGISRVIIGLLNGAGGDLVWYTSHDRGDTWVEIGSDAVSAASADTMQFFDWLVETHPDWKVEWENDGSAQDPWLVEISLIGERNPGA